MFCSRCGFEIDSQENFCASCGAIIESDTQGDGEKAGYTKLEKKNSKQAHSNNQPSKNGGLFIGLGWAFFAISILFIPIIFGAGSFVMGYLVRREHSETHGTILMIMAVAGAILGMLLDAASAGY